MSPWKFRQLFSVLQNRVKEDGKKSPAWFLGFVEGLGSRKLSGVQIGALVDLLLLPDKESDMEIPEGMEVLDENNLPDFDFLKSLHQ